MPTPAKANTTTPDLVAGSPIDVVTLDAGVGVVDRQVVAVADATVATQYLGVTAAGAAKVDGSAVTQPVSGTFFQPTQPVSAVALPLPTGAATLAGQTQPGVDIGDVTINNAGGAAAVNVQDGGNSVTVDAPVGTPVFARLSDGAATLIGQKPMAASLPVVVSSDQTVIPVSDNTGSLTVDAPVGTPAFVRLSDGAAAQVGQKTMAASLPVVVASDQDATTGVPTRASPLCVVLAPAANTGGTITLPAVAGQFHYITAIEITRNATAALAGTATLAITTTNLPGGGTWYRVGNAMVAGGTQKDVAQQFSSPIKSSVANTNTTIVFPVPGAAVLWTATVWYYAAA